MPVTVIQQQRYVRGLVCFTVSRIKPQELPGRFSLNSEGAAARAQEEPIIFGADPFNMAHNSICFLCFIDLVGPGHIIFSSKPMTIGWSSNVQTHYIPHVTPAWPESHNSRNIGERNKTIVQVSGMMCEICLSINIWFNESGPAGTQ